MYIKRIDEASKTLDVAIPLTSTAGKTRIKKRNTLNEYGISVPTRTVMFDEKCYVEWQIGYDVTISETDKSQFTTLKNISFIGANGHEKYLYELSEYIYYFFKWGTIERHELEELKNYLSDLDDSECLDVNRELCVGRDDFNGKTINDFDFSFTKVKYPLLVHRFEGQNMIAEILIKEKQKAIGIQPMLYFCFPLTELKDGANYIGRTANKKEEAFLEITEDNISVFFEMLKIFGTLSSRHKRDVISIIDAIICELL